MDERFRCDGVPDCIGEEFPFVAFDEEAEQCPTRGDFPKYTLSPIEGGIVI